jgi:hypothetical protein
MIIPPVAAAANPRTFNSKDDPAGRFLPEDADLT